jgi:hypothetical protein
VPKNETQSNIKIVRLVFFFFGILIIAAGFYATESRITQFALRFSTHKALSEQTIPFLYGLRIKIILLGIMSVLLSIFAGYLVLLEDSLVRKIESEHLIERAASFIGKLLGLIYRIGTNEKFLWCLLILLVISYSIASVLLSSAGGTHVEGIILQPAKNLVRHGIYATLTTRGFDEYTYRISVGPGIILPNAIVFKLFGINVYYSRAIFVAFVIATLILFYYIARDLYGKKVALLALFLIAPMMTPPLIIGGDPYFPALFYFLIGALYWFKSIDTKKNIFLIISGLFWGLSFQTHWLFLFAIFALIITCIVLRLSNNSPGSKYYLIPTSMVFLVTIAWFFFRILNVGLRREYWHLLQFWGEHGHRAIGVSTEEGSVASIFAFFRPIATLAQVDLWGFFQLFLIIPAILYIIILIGKSKWTDYKNLFFICFVLTWVTWWLIFNYDLPGNHVLIVCLISQLFIAKLLYDIWQYSSAYKDGFLNLVKNKETQESTVFYGLRVIVICIVLGRVLLPVFDTTNKLYNRYLTLTKPYVEMMTYIKDKTEKEAVFSGWDWSMPWYVDLDDTEDHIIKDRTTYPPEQRETVPEYFLVSPEWPLVRVTDEWPNVVVVNKWSNDQNELRKKFVEQNCTLVKTFGGDKHKWLLYKVNNDK